MIKIGLTGNIAAGKSEVEKIFNNLGINSLDADTICHDMLENDKEVISLVLNLFKGEDITTNGKIDRKKLGKIVFSDINKKRELEKLLHPYVIKEGYAFFDREKDSKMCVVDIPLLFEKNYEYLVDKIILVYASDKIRLERIKKRNNLDEEYIKKIMKAQMNQEAKKEKSDYVIINENKSLDELEEEIKKIIKELS